MLIAVLVLLVVLIGITSAGTRFAYNAAKNSRWLQETWIPWANHLTSLVDPNYPPVTPPDVKG